MRYHYIYRWSDFNLYGWEEKEMKAEVIFLTEEDLINNFTSHWLEFVIYARSEKTVAIKVRNKEENQTIGIIAWYKEFRAYAFRPFPSTVFERVCLRDITNVLEELEKIRKGRITKRRNKNES